MKHSSFAFKIKDGVDDAGRFSGLLASYGTVDLGGDKIMPGAFTKTLSEGKSYPLLWQHKADQPIGSFTAKETQTGLEIQGQLILSIKQAADCRELLKHKVLSGLSIGYDTVKADYSGDVRELRELRLWEGSVVTFPMNESCMVTSVKVMSDDDRAKHFQAINTHRKAIDKHQRAIRESLKCLFDGMDDDDDEPADDPALLESSGEDYGEMSAIIAEMKSLAEQANELAEA